MNMQDYTTPFAINGDRDEFSIDTDPSGNVSLERGWTEPYQLKPEEGGKFIPRRIFNQMMNLVSTDTVTWKTQTFSNWIADKGDGTPYAYPKNAIVKYTNGNVYVSKVANNTTVPTNATNWLLYNPANGYVELTGDQTIAGVKTFSANPISTATQGTAVNALTRKDYVDELNTITSLTDKVTPVDTDVIKIQESGGLFKKLSWARIKATLFDGAMSLTPNGYIKFPTVMGGWIVQWAGTLSDSVGLSTWTYPISFPNQVFKVFPVPTVGAGAQRFTVTLDSSNTNNNSARVSAWNGDTQSSLSGQVGVSWLAIGK